MDKFNIESAKFVSIIIGICFIFIMVIWHAFDYLPAASDNPVVNNIVVPTEDEPSKIKQNSEENISEETQTKKIEDVQEKEITEKPVTKFEPLEPIHEEISENSVKTDSIDEILNKAKDYRENNKYTAAISEYQKAISSTEDKEITAQCYEEISLIYAKAKRYGSALSAAQRAYNTSPSSSREVLLARLYYKTGDIDKATTRINNVLKRDF